jgi:GNAT superfamily N-acetyltransferase
MSSLVLLDNIYKITPSNLGVLTNLLNEAVLEGWEGYEFIYKDYHLAKNQRTYCYQDKGLISYKVHDTIDDRIAFCSFLYVLQGERGRGIGLKLKLDSETELKSEGVTLIKTYTHETNISTIKLNKHCEYDLMNITDGWVCFEKRL